jgi:hypothetical protein
MALTAQSIIRGVVTALKDPTAVRWKTDELVRYLNDGQRDIVAVRPDATATAVSMALAAGARQTLPAAGAKLIEVVRNTNGAQRSIRATSRVLMDAHNPSWYSKAGVEEIHHYMFDMREPRVFYVYPPAAVGASVELVYSAYPTDVATPATGALYTDVVGNLSVQDIFANALTNYILYRAFSKDAETVNATAASAHYQLYQSMLGLELNGTSGVAPKG